MFDVDAWLDRCRTCIHSKEENTYGTTCTIKGSCQFEKIPEMNNLQDREDAYICCRCKKIFPKADMSRQSCRGKSYYRYCKPCKNYMTQAAIDKRIEKYITENGIDTATCRICKQTKHITEFKATVGKFGQIQFKTCAICIQAYNHKRYARSRGKLDD